MGLEKRGSERFCQTGTKSYWCFMSSQNGEFLRIQWTQAAEVRCQLCSGGSTIPQVINKGLSAEGLTCICMRTKLQKLDSELCSSIRSGLKRWSSLQGVSHLEVPPLCWNQAVLWEHWFNICTHWTLCVCPDYEVSLTWFLLRNVLKRSQNKRDEEFICTHTRATQIYDSNFVL